MNELGMNSQEWVGFSQYLVIPNHPCVSTPGGLGVSGFWAYKNIQM